ncbi:hypothetical protein [Plantactinospora soyae]|uniref:Uncharacterized protein n=1 Tax=Plantactinospora soyae TaxID=1544732 RepID=A0A927M5S0_9ACTN|nr:hypothetical protein [Plantactinospora soyae]MBE1488527.1 hypothetical protein [Plantactinospora soyae]
MTTTGSPVVSDGGGVADPAAVQDAIEYCYERGWTDGLPVVPCDQALLDRFLAQTDRDPGDVVFAMPHLNRNCTVRLAALNAAMAGCRPEYFPVVLAAWDSLAAEGYLAKGIWQSTTGTAPLVLVNGPVRERIGLNGRGNVFGPGFRANATIGRALRLTALNAFGLRPRELDQATQGTPAKYTLCIAENEEESPWTPFSAQFGFAAGESTVTALTIRSVVHVEARHTGVPEQLLRDFADTVARTGALLHETISACLVLSPEHAHLLADAGWDRQRISRYVFETAVRSRVELDLAGKGSVSRKSRWRVPGDHPDAVADREAETDPASTVGAGRVHVLNSPEAVLVTVAGASNSGVSAVVETFGPRGGSPHVVPVAEL